MLTPKQIEKAAEKIIPIWDDLKEWITLDLIDRIIMRLGRDEDITFSSSEKYRISVFEELGGLVTELQNRITRTVNISEQQLKQVFLDYAETAVKQDSESLNIIENTPEKSPKINENTSGDKLHPEPQNTAQNEPQTKTVVSNTMSDRMKDIANDAYLRTNGELRNFTGTTADSTQTQFIEELDKAYLKVASNTCSQWQAAREAIDNIIKYQGRVTYPSGHTDTIEVAVIRAIRTGIARMSAQLTLQSAEENGIDHVVVSGHLGARTGDGGENAGNHAWWQSKVYKIKGKDDKYPNLGETTGYPHDPHGLCGYNCRHSIALFDPDVMRNPFKQYGEEENKEYYENTQKQRKYEREIRKAKTEVNALAKALETATDPKLKESLQTSLDEAKAKRDNLLDEYRTFCNEHGFRAEYERMEIANRGRLSDSDKSGGENSPGDGVANSAESGIIKSKEVQSPDELSKDYRPVMLNEKDTNFVVRESETFRVTFTAYRSETTVNNIYISEGNRDIKRKELHQIDTQLTEVLKIMGISGRADLPMIYIVNSAEMNKNAVAAYRASDNALFIDSAFAVYKKDNPPEAVQGFACPKDSRSTFVHELFHWKDAQDFRDRFGEITPENYNDYEKYVQAQAKYELERLQKIGYNIFGISDYATISIKDGKYDEAYTEYRVKNTLKG